MDFDGVLDGATGRFTKQAGIKVILCLLVAWMLVASPQGRKMQVCKKYVPAFFASKRYLCRSQLDEPAFVDT